MKTKHRKAAQHKRDVLRAAGPDILNLTLRMSSELPQADRDNLEMALTMAVNTICQGNGTPTEYNDILEAVTISRILAQRIKDEQTAEATFEVANDGMHALNSMRARYVQHKRLGFTGPELQAVRDALDLYVQFLTNCKRGELVNALRETEKEIRGAQPEQERKKAA